MGSVIEKRAVRFFGKKSNKNVKSKGERLGWSAIENEKEISLRSIIGDGCIVKPKSCFMSVSGKIVL